MVEESDKVDPVNSENENRPIPPGLKHKPKSNPEQFVYVVGSIVIVAAFVYLNRIPIHAEAKENTAEDKVSYQRAYGWPARYSSELWVSEDKQILGKIEIPEYFEPSKHAMNVQSEKIGYLPLAVNAVFATIVWLMMITVAIFKHRLRFWGSLLMFLYISIGLILYTYALELSVKFE